jgi:hypothetical protein
MTFEVLHNCTLDLVSRVLKFRKYTSCVTFGNIVGDENFTQNFGSKFSMHEKT